MVNKSRSVKAVNKWWGDSQKIEAVQTYLMIGTVQGAARMLKIPEQTMYSWTRQPWWQEIVGELKLQDQLQLSSRLKKIVEKTFDVVEDRLEHGDYVYDQKSGEMRRKPVSMRDAHKVGLELDNKRTILLDRAVPTASEEAIDDKLNKLAEKFAAIVNGKKLTDEEPLDVEAREIVGETEMVQDEPMAGEVLFDDGESTASDLLQEVESRAS